MSYLFVSERKNRISNRCRPTEIAPHIAIVAVEFEDILEVFNGFVEVLLCAKDAADFFHGLD